MPSFDIMKLIRLQGNQQEWQRLQNLSGILKQIESRPDFNQIKTDERLKKEKIKPPVENVTTDVSIKKNIIAPPKVISAGKEKLNIDIGEKYKIPVKTTALPEQNKPGITIAQKEYGTKIKREEIKTRQEVTTATTTPEPYNLNQPITLQPAASTISEETKEIKEIFDAIVKELENVSENPESLSKFIKYIKKQYNQKDRNDKIALELYVFLLKYFPDLFKNLKINLDHFKSYLQRYINKPDDEEFKIDPSGKGLNLKQKIILAYLAGKVDDDSFDDFLMKEIDKIYIKVGNNVEKKYQAYIGKAIYEEIKKRSPRYAGYLLENGFDFKFLEKIPDYLGDKEQINREYIKLVHGFHGNAISIEDLERLKSPYNKTFNKLVASIIEYLNTDHSKNPFDTEKTKESQEALEKLQKVVDEYNDIFSKEHQRTSGEGAGTLAQDYNSLANRIAKVLERNDPDEIHNLETQLGITHGTLRDYYLSLSTTLMSFIHQWAIAHNYLGKTDAELYELLADELGITPEQLESFLESARANPNIAIGQMLEAGASIETVNQLLEIAGVGPTFYYTVLNTAASMGIATNVPVDLTAIITQYAQEHGLTPGQVAELTRILNNLPENIIKEIARLTRYMLNPEDRVMAFQAIAQLIKDKVPGFEDMSVKDIQELLAISNLQSQKIETINKELIEKIRQDNPYLADILEKKGTSAYKLESDKIFKETDPEGYEIYKKGGIKAYEKYIDEKRRSFLENLKSTDPEGYEIYQQKGYEAYEQYINKKVKEFEETLKTNDPVGFKIYEKSGYEAYEKYADARLARDIIALQIMLEAGDPEGLKVFKASGGGVKGYDAFLEFDEKRYNDALAQLKDYEIELHATSDKEKDITYDINRYIKDHPTLDAVKTLIILGFDEGTIKAATSYVSGVNSSLTDIDNFLKNKPIQQLKGIILPIDPDAALEASIRDVKGIIKIPYKIDTERSKSAGIDIYVDEKGRVVTPREILAYKWNQLTNEEKQKVATLWGNNYYQGNYFVEYKNLTEEKLSGTDALIFAAEIFVPGLYVARHWDELSNWEKVLYVGLDALSVGVIGASAIRVMGAAARGVGYSSRLARLGAAARALGEIAIAQVKFPVDLILHPIKTGKSIINLWKDARDLLELLVNRRRIREAALTTASGQVLIRSSDLGSPKAAQIASDKLMQYLARGEKLYFKIGDKAIELAQSPLMKETAGAAHATTDLTDFEKGLVVKYEEGLPISEQGLFLSNEPVTNYTYMSATGKGAIPIATEASGKAERVFMYRPGDIARMDAVPIRNLTFAHCKNIGEDAAPIIERIVKKYGGKLGGSWTFYVKVPNAPKPNDLDWILDRLSDARAAQKEIVTALNRAGIKARYGKTQRSVEIFKDGEWKEAVDIWLTAGHNSQIPKEYIQATRRFGGFNFETLGEQYIRQSYGSVTESARTGQRIKSINKVAPVLEKLLKNDGAIVRRPGIVIYDPKTAQEAITTEKFFHPVELNFETVKEVESKLKVGYKTPPISQKLWFRCGPRGIRTELWLVKPLDNWTILKLKDMGLLEDIKAPFKPAVKVKDFGTGIQFVKSDDQAIHALTNLLVKNKNITRAQAANTLRAFHTVTAPAVRVPAPTLERFGIKRTPSDLARIYQERFRYPGIERETRVGAKKSLRRPGVLRETSTKRISSRPEKRITSTRSAVREIPEREPGRSRLGERPTRGTRGERITEGTRKERLTQGDRGERLQRDYRGRTTYRGYKQYITGKKEKGRIIPPRIPVGRPPKITRYRGKRKPSKSEDKKWTREEIKSAVAFRMGSLAHTSKALIHDNESIYIITKSGGAPNLLYPLKNVTETPPKGFADSGWRFSLPENQRRSNLETSFEGNMDDLIEGLLALSRVSKNQKVVNSAKKDLEYFRSIAQPEDILSEDTKISLKKVSKENPDIQRIYPLVPVTIARRTPYTEEDQKVFVGDTPPGMSVKPDLLSAKKSVQLLTNEKPPPIISGRVGFQTYQITKPNKIPGGGKIAFQPNRGFRSELKNQIYHTNLNGNIVLSRQPLKQGRRRKKVK